QIDIAAVEVGQNLVPAALFESRFAAHFSAERIGQVHLEADDARRLFGIGIDVGATPFAVRSPPERLCRRACGLSRMRRDAKQNGDSSERGKTRAERFRYGRTAKRIVRRDDSRMATLRNPRSLARILAEQA